MMLLQKASSFQSKVVIGLMLTTGNAWSQTDADPSFTTFSEAYGAYQTAVDAGDWVAARSAARYAYELGFERFGRIHINTARLAMNYGGILIDTGADHDLARQLLTEADEIFAELDDPDAEDRIHTKMRLAAAQTQYEDKLASINAALSLQRAATPDDAIAYARRQTAGGVMLISAQAGSSEGKTMLTAVLETLEGAFGEGSQELFQTLMGLGAAGRGIYTGSGAQREYYRRAYDIAKSLDESDSETLADLDLYIGRQLARPADAEYAMRYLRRAVDTFERLHGAQHPKFASAAYEYARALATEGDTGQARIHVENAIDFYSTDPMYVTSLIEARRLLMAIYLDRKNEKRFTEQLSEIGRLSEGFATPDEQLPVLKYTPVYPSRAASAGAEGYVVVEFTVDDEGRTQDVVVIESYSEHGKGEWFHDSAITAARQFRYIPRYENGLPVSVSKVRNKLTYVLER
jgi:TonB family protein